jgi:hypothetical protein
MNSLARFFLTLQLRQLEAARQSARGGVLEVLDTLILRTKARLVGLPEPACAADRKDDAE